MFRTVALLCFAVAFTVDLSSTKAAVVYELAFRFSGEADLITNGANFVVASREDFLGVEMLLVERLSGTSQSILGNDSLVNGNRFGNLAGFQANINALGADGQFSNAQVNLTGGQANPNNDADTIGYLALGTNFFNQPGLGSFLIGPETRAALLGTVDLKAPTLGQTIFSLSDFSTFNGDFGTWGAGGLEGAASASGGSFNGGSFSFTAVPEPGSVAVLGVISCGALVRFRKRLGRGLATA